MSWARIARVLRKAQHERTSCVVLTLNPLSLGRSKAARDLGPTR